MYIVYKYNIYKIFVSCTCIFIDMIVFFSLNGHKTGFLCSLSSILLRNSSILIIALNALSLRIIVASFGYHPYVVYFIGIQCFVQALSCT